MVVDRFIEQKIQNILIVLRSKKLLYSNFLSNSVPHYSTSATDINATHHMISIYIVSLLLQSLLQQMCK